MKIPDSYIFIDSSSGISDQDIDHRIREISDSWKTYRQISSNAVSEFTGVIDSLKNANALNNYAILTKCSAKYAGKFISNNIIDVSGINADNVIKQLKWVFSDFGLGNTTNDNAVFFTSDQHFFHNRIIQYCNRPWSSGKDSSGNLIVTAGDVERMNEDLIANWNSVVEKNSKVFCLGDFCLGANQTENIPKLVARLNGNITLIIGNHDRHSLKFYYDAGFAEVSRFPILWNGFFILSHEPVQWIRDGMPYANLFGHVHNQETYRNITQNTYNCCVEVNGYKPVSFAEIKRKMSECAEIAGAV